MPRPQTLQTTGRQPQSDAYHLLTPRTPRGHHDGDDHGPDEDGGYATYAQQQSEPLLASSTSDHFPQHVTTTPARSKRTVKGAVGAGLSRIPMIGGILVAIGILAMLGVSVKRPDVLEKALLGNNTVSSMGTSHLHPVNSSEFISYENYTEFPLTPEQYLMECEKNMGGLMHPHRYWDMDPQHMGPYDVWHAEDKKVCNMTITYMLSGEVGLFADLALLAQTVALARERNRTLFIDDTFWDRGNWTDHFEDLRSLLPGPQPDCKPPPPDELVACPRLARHWVVTSRTAKYHFSHGFDEEYDDPYAHDLNRRKPVFERAVASFRDVIRPNAQNMGLVKKARTALAAALPDKKYLGVHVRRGDRSIQSWKYHDKYVPLNAYIDAAGATWKRLVDDGPAPPPVWLASDSPAAIDEWSKTAPAKVFSLRASGDADLKNIASPWEYVQAEFDELPEEERLEQTRGMVVDFGLMSGMWAEDGDVVPEAVVCGMSSVICDMAAVAMGWTRAFGLEDGDKPDGSWDEDKKRWVEVENGGVVSPMWMALRMF